MDARERLTPGAAVVPRRGSQFATLIESDDVASITSVKGWEGIDLAWFNTLQVRTQRPSENTQRPSECIQSPSERTQRPSEQTQSALPVLSILPTLWRRRLRQDTASMVFTKQYGFRFSSCKYRELAPKLRTITGTRTVVYDASSTP